MTPNSLEKLRLELIRCKSGFEFFFIAIHKLSGYHYKIEESGDFKMPFADLALKATPLEELIWTDDMKINPHLKSYISECCINEMLIKIREEFGEDYWEELVLILKDID